MQPMQYDTINSNRYSGSKHRRTSTGTCVELCPILQPPRVVHTHLKHNPSVHTSFTKAFSFVGRSPKPS